MEAREHRRFRLYAAEFRRIAAHPRRILDSRVARFGLVGVAATLTHGSILAATTTWADLSPFLGNTLGIVCSAWVSYVGHRSFTFRSREGHGATSSKFLIQFLLSWAVTSALAIVLVPVVGRLPAAVLVVTLSPVLNYFVYALWTFRAAVSPGAGLQHDTRA